jgi:hypothetical protein
VPGARVARLTPSTSSGSEIEAAEASYIVNGVPDCKVVAPINVQPWHSLPIPCSLPNGSS